LVALLTSSPWCGVKNACGILVCSKEYTFQSCNVSHYPLLGVSRERFTRDLCTKILRVFLVHRSLLDFTVLTTFIIMQYLSQIAQFERLKSKCFTEDFVFQYLLPLLGPNIILNVLSSVIIRVLLFGERPSFIPIQNNR
jgi:hypothetical protein